MQVILFFFLTTFSCGFAQGKNHPESAANNLLAADVKKLPSAEESHVPEDGDGASVNVEEILRELKEERAKNRDLNQTISDMLEEMENMKRNIIRNEERIDQAQSSVVLLSKDVDDLTDEVTAVQDDVVMVAEDVERNSANITIVFDDVAAVQDDVVAVAEDVESLSSSDQLQAGQIHSLGTRGTWCGHKFSWSTVGTISYNRLTFSDYNMEITGTPLDINTGIFTVPVSGVWRMTYSLLSRVYSGNVNWARLYINGGRVQESDHYTYSESGDVRSTGGREVTREVSQGDTIELRTTTMGGTFYDIIYCAEYLPKM